MKRCLLLGLILTSACSLLPNKDKTPQAPEKVGDPQARPQASIETKQVAAEQEAETIGEVSFAKGRATLTGGEMARLKKVDAAFADPKKIRRVVVAAWADQTLPGENAKPLPESAVKLAEERGRVVREFLEKHGAKGVDMEFHNMAKKPSQFAKIVGAEDARIKKSLEGARPSKAIVLVVDKD